MKITGSKIFNFFNIIFMVLIIFVMAYPLYYVLMASFSDPQELSRHVGILLAPLRPFTLDAYRKVFADPQIVTGFMNTAFVLVVGVSVNMVLTVLGAYFLSVKGPMLSTPITFMIVFTMYFSGGLVPAYLNLRDLGMLNSLWSLILPVGINTSNLIIMRSGFTSIPDSLVESARLDGASYVQILIRVMIPLAKATLAVIVLYYAVAHWNSWFSASIYLRSESKYPLQLVMQQILKDSEGTIADGVGADEAAQVAQLIKYALIVVTTAPILILYPFLQKYFVKGVMVGAIKG